MPYSQARVPTARGLAHNYFPTFSPQALLALAASPAAWAALLTLIVLEVVLGVDNLIFISLLSNRLPQRGRARTRTIGTGRNGSFNR